MSFEFPVRKLEQSFITASSIRRISPGLNLHDPLHPFRVYANPTGVFVDNVGIIWHQVLIQLGSCCSNSRDLSSSPVTPSGIQRSSNSLRYFCQFLNAFGSSPFFSIVLI